MKGDYITLKQRASDEFVEKKSRFIGYACPVETEEQAVAFINEIRAKHRDARHNVYAYIVNNNGVVNQRYSDDGEPQGTGGMPVMDVIMKQGLINCCVVVTRYFGGILLGASGLVRAYSHGASIAVEAAGILKVIECKPLKITVPYGIYDRLMSYFAPFGYTQVSADFSTDVTVVYDIPTGEVGKRQAEIIDMTNGRAIVEVLKD